MLYNDCDSSLQLQKHIAEPPLCHPFAGGLRPTVRLGEFGAVCMRLIIQLNTHKLSKLLKEPEKAASYYQQCLYSYQQHAS